MHWLVRYFRRNFHQVRPSVNQGRLPYCVNVGVYLLMNDKGEAPLFCYTGYSHGGEHRVWAASPYIVYETHSACVWQRRQKAIYMYVCMYVNDGHDIRFF